MCRWCFLHSAEQQRTQKCKDYFPSSAPWCMNLSHLHPFQSLLLWIKTHRRFLHQAGDTSCKSHSKWTSIFDLFKSQILREYSLLRPTALCWIRTVSSNLGSLGSEDWKGSFQSSKRSGILLLRLLSASLIHMGPPLGYHWCRIPLQLPFSFWFWLQYAFCHL